jgi:hypothetical protein
MRRVTFRKVYGWRDPNSRVEEIHDVVGLYECYIRITAYPPIIEPLNLDDMFRSLYQIMRQRQAQYQIENFSGPVCEPITQKKIDRVFGLTGKSEKSQLQNILDKVKRHT